MGHGKTLRALTRGTTLWNPLLLLGLASVLALGYGTAAAQPGGTPPVIEAPPLVTGAEGTLITFQVTVTPAAGCTARFGSFHLLPPGGDAAWTPCTGCVISSPTTFTFTWTPTLDDAGEYDVILSALSGPFPACRGRAIARVHITVTEAGGEPQFGSISGQVTAECPATGTPLFGVDVAAVEVGTGNVLGSATTDVNGNYSIPDLPVGPYNTVISVPLGYATAVNENPVEVLANQDVASNFDLSCQAIESAPRTIGFWKHQFGVATGGRGNAQVDGATLCSYLDLVEGHFNSNAINQVVVYTAPVSGTCDDKLVVGKVLLNLHGSVDMIDRARQQLLALLLNAASGKVGLMNAASADGATISQAITYCDNLIDDPDGDHEKAKTIADLINNGETVPAGMIPLETANIAYRRALLEFAAGPSPTRGPSTFRFALARGGSVSLAVFDVKGRLVRQVFEGSLGAGRHTLAWNGKTDRGAAPGAGIYFAKLSMSNETRTLKIVRVPR